MTQKKEARFYRLQKFIPGDLLDPANPHGKWQDVPWYGGFEIPTLDDVRDLVQPGEKYRVYHVHRIEHITEYRNLLDGEIQT